MDPERWQRIKEVFPTVLELSPELRAAWLEAALPDDPSLIAEVESLLDAHDGAGDFYDRGALAAVPELREQLDGAVEGMILGPYRILSELGRGGMGAVYLAVRDEPGFTRKVAIKLVKRGMDTDEIVRRFVAERQILASLAHPNVARLFDVGSAPDGRPYFVMEHVEGKPITAYADERELSVEARLHLFLHVCRAVQHAHQSLVVHRDLKPANILVDAEGQPKLLDFGIAKLLDPHSFGGLTALTGLAPGPMTPEYASPEQRAGGAVTTATDVYGLGLLLYELLVGQSLRAVERRLGEGWAERPPSQALRALAAVGDGKPRRGTRRLSGDLDAIVGKALEPEPARRYGTANALAEDIERHLTQRPVTARRLTLAYRLGRTVVRHKWVATLALGLVVLAVFASVLAFTQSRQRSLAEEQSERAEALNDLLLIMIQQIQPAQSPRVSRAFREYLDLVTAALLSPDSRRPPKTSAVLLEAVSETYGTLGLYDKAENNLTRALALRRSLPDPSREDDLALAGNLTALGEVEYQLQKYAQSQEAHRRAIRIKERRLGSDALPQARDRNGLGLVLIKIGKLEEASDELARALKVSRLAGGEGHESLAATFNNLGYLDVQRNSYRRARVFFLAALRYYRAGLGHDHPDTMVIRNNLAYLYLQDAEYGLAEKMYQELAADCRRRFEPDHPDLADTLLQLALVERQADHLAAAGETLKELEEIRRALGFPRDEIEAERLNLVGTLALERNELDTAEEAFVRSVKLYASLAGDHRSARANVMSGQVQIRRRRGDLQGALTLARRRLALARAASASPGLDSDFARAASQLGSCHLDVGDPAQARPLLEEAYRIQRRLHRPDHPDVQKVADLLRRLPASPR